MTNKHKQILSIIVIVLGIVALIFAIKNRASNPETAQTPQTNQSQHGTYNIEDKNLGYSFDMSDEIFAGYQEEHQGYITNYMVPLDSSHTKYTPVFSIIATPIEQANEFQKLCAADKQTAPIQCTNYTKSDGKNNHFYFDIKGSQASTFLDGTKANMDKLESIISAVKSSIKFMDIKALPTTLVYQDHTAGYEFTYLSSLDRTFDESVVESLPDGLDTAFNYTAPGYTKILPIKHCGLSGKCDPTTTNFSISVGSIPINEQQLLSSQLGKSLTKLQVNGTNVYSYNMGAEGEGIEYHFVVSANPDQIIVFIHKYIDETVVHNYASVKDFTKFTDQKRIVNDMIKSLVFQQPIIIN